MNINNLNEKCHQWLKTLCVDIKERTTGSQGNRDAARFFREQLEALGWETESQVFEAVDWINGGATLHAGKNEFEVLVSPWSNGCAVKAVMESAPSISELEKGGFRDKVILLHGEIEEYTQLQADAREEAIQRMTKDAEKLDADAIIGVRIATAMVTRGAAEILAFGTAIKLK